MKILNVVGARPNFMKIAPLTEEMKRFKSIEPVLVHTGQHYDQDMSDVFLRDLNLPVPDIYLRVGSETHAKQTAKIMVEFEEVLIKEKPDLVVVVGDVNSTLACSLVAAKMMIPVAHVEAGLRSFDRTMPEEINRVVTDSLSDYLFTTCMDANKNLIREGIPKNKIFFAGNLMIDTLLKYKNRVDLSILKKLGLKKGTYALLTLHRPSNVDKKEIFIDIVNALEEIGECIPVVFPIHPRTRKNIGLFGLSRYFVDCSNNNQSISRNGIFLLPPLGYLDFLSFMKNSKFVMTDSGGLQEETTVLGIPCLTLRENTERPITVSEGTNVIVGKDKRKIIKEAFNILSGRKKKGKIPKYWDGKTAKRIVKKLLEIQNH